MSVDTISDFLTVIRNGLMIRRRSIYVQHSKLKEGIAEVLKAEGYIKDFKKVEEDGKYYIVVFLKYIDGESVIHEITRISRPGRRRYERMGKITSVIGGLGVSILTTSRGTLSDKQAKVMGVGGEVICHIW